MNKLKNVKFCLDFVLRTIREHIRSTCISINVFQRDKCRKVVGREYFPLLVMYKLFFT